MPKNRIFLFITSSLILLYSCNNTQKTHTGNCLSIEYNTLGNFKDAKIIIDNTVFFHTKYQDSILMEQYLPEKEVILFTTNEKIASKKMNKIDIAIVLVKKISKSKEYVLLNPQQTLTQGIVKFRRKDKKKIILKTNNNYPAKVKITDCTK
ncbi:hypothetical protein ACFSTE_12500 [Aquimarina hainanensis]|uniref:Uncharacterized protein n=1 Tax=Aquimarina hainanensis TaxID=1578017 RepID=A0ABW5N7Q7_9FLAO